MKKPLILIALLLTCALCCQKASADANEMMPSAIDGTERTCLDCHRSANIHSNEGVFSSKAFCLECHAAKACEKIVGQTRVSLRVDAGTFEKTPHEYVACIHCHTDVARSPHKTDKGAECMGCHAVHGEETAHAPHLRVSCQACHRKSEHVELDKETGMVRLSHTDDKDRPIGLTDHALPKDMDNELFCRRCHHGQNQVGAAATVLPSKGVLCILCHNAPLALGHPVFIAGLLIFVLGLVLTWLFWFRGSVQGEEESLHRKIALSSESLWRIVFSREIFSIIKTVLLDIVLQRRILQESVKRWAIHSLIYLSILGRFFLGLLSYVAYKTAPDSALALTLMDKNHGFTAFVYDLLGLFIVLGLLWAIVQRFILKPSHTAREGQDNIALIIIGILILLGFILEGARILMTQTPPQAAVYSFIGYPLSRLLSFLGLDWKIVYPVLWYGHGIFGALLIAYLPFGKMKHVFNTPLTLLMNYKMK